MVNRLRTGWLAGSGALVLVLAFSGGVMGATLVTDTTATFEDIDGDGVDDDCQEAALENTEAATAAFEAADLNDDGEISVIRGGPERLDRRRELQPRRLREPGCPGR